MIRMKRLFVMSLFGVAVVAALVSSAMVLGIGEGSSVTMALTNYNPEPASAGGTFDAHIRLDNIGDGTQNLVVQAEDTYPFTATGKTVQNVSLGPYQTGNDYIDLDYTMLVDRGVTAGVYALKVRYMSVGGTSWVEQAFNVTVSGNQFAQIIYVDQAQLNPGVQTPLNFTITNIGNSALQNLVFSWSDKNGYILPVFGDNTKYIKYLDVGQSVKLSYTVIANVNAPLGLDALTLNLNYQSASNGTPSVLTTTAGMFIGGKTDFDVSFAESSAGQTSLSIANTGSVQAFAVKVSVPPQPMYQVTGSNAAIIGNLNPGDYTLVSFQIVQRSFNASGNETRTGRAGSSGSASNGSPRFFGANGSSFGGGLNMVVDIEYTDPTGTRQLVEKSIPIQFRGSSTSGFGTGGTTGRASSVAWWQSPFVVGLLVVIIIVGGYFFYTQRKAMRLGKK
jgi:hypothetical protein